MHDEIRFYEGLGIQVRLNDDDGTQVEVVGEVRTDDEGDLYLPHAGYITNQWGPNLTMFDKGWQLVRIVSL